MPEGLEYLRFGGNQELLELSILRLSHLELKRGLVALVGRSLSLCFKLLHLGFKQLVGFIESSDGDREADLHRILQLCDGVLKLLVC